MHSLLKKKITVADLKVIIEKQNEIILDLTQRIETLEEENRRFQNQKYSGWRDNINCPFIEH